MKFNNPIIPGMNPDPSICRVGHDYYMVCSSMEFYPGIPIFHSRDLAHWEQIGNVMTKENSFHQKANTLTGGVMAPTIRYHNGTFYVLNANFADRGNFYVTAKNPVGPWSQPHWMDDVPGIDASFFFDTDGQAYICGTGDITNPKTGAHERGIWSAKYDFEAGHRTSEPHAIWDSALRGASSPEAPHLYHIGDWYYLMIAEGGTEYWHSVTIARSRSLDSWFEGNPANPIMTHRNLGLNAPISNVGHADLVDTPEGKWFAVLLGSRLIEGVHKNIGRESFICPVGWQMGWPVFAPLVGQVTSEFEADVPEDTSRQKNPVDATGTSTLPDGDIVTDFTADTLPIRMILWGTPYGDVYRLHDGKLYLSCLPRAINAPMHTVWDKEFNARHDDCVAFVGSRQISINFVLNTCVHFNPDGKETAGIVIAQSLNNQYRLEEYRAHDGRHARLVRTVSHVSGMPHMPGFSSTSHDTVLGDIPWTSDVAYMRLEVVGQRYRFFIGNSQDSLQQIGKDCDGVAINPDMISGTGSLGCTITGLFASSNGTKSSNKAAFDFFSYKVIDSQHE